jgi:hypothetical protein
VVQIHNQKLLQFHKYQLKTKNLRKLKEDNRKSQNQIIVIMTQIRKMSQEEVMQLWVEMEVKDHH